MDEISLDVLISALVVLIFLSAFFSSSETGMMSLNRYRLSHLAKKKHKAAMRASSLLSRPDRLIGVILIGNNLVNVAAASLATILFTKLYGDAAGPLISTVVLTLALLVFSEVTPKTIAALYPEKIAFPASIVLRPLLILFYPLVVLVNVISNGLLRILGVNPAERKGLADALHPEELRTVVDEAGDLIPDQHQGMLLNVLDLEKATVEDIMIPRNEVVGIDLEDSTSEILEQICKSEFTRLPVFEGDINNVVGILHLRKAARFLKGNSEELSHDAIRQHMRPPYFVPESTPLPRLLMNFQREKRRFGIVVDEYGDVQGAVTLVDLLEEIVGEFSTDGNNDEEQEVIELTDGWYLIDASVSVRDINRHLNWQLPTDGPKTINGIIVEYLESIPEGACTFMLENYLFEITSIGGTRIEETKIKLLEAKESH